MHDRDQKADEIIGTIRGNGHINIKVEFGEGEGKVPLDNIAKRAEEYKPEKEYTESYRICESFACSEKRDKN